MGRTQILSELRDKALHSSIEESLAIVDRAWKEVGESSSILDSLHPVSLFTFSHRFPTIHVPKEHEYLYRLLKLIPQEEHIDFLRRFVEYLAWSPKYVFNATDVFTSGARDPDSLRSYLEAMEEHKGLAALFYALETANERSLDDVLRTILQVGCNDVSQSIGHYFSCTESVVKLAMDAGMPLAKNHLFLLTLYVMQSFPIVLRDYREPSLTLDEILSRLVKKGGFFGYHYMILASGLIRNREFIGDRHYLHALQGLEEILPQLEDTLSTEKIDSMIRRAPKSSDTIKDLKNSIWKGDKPKAFALLRKYLEEEGITEELASAIAHTYTRIDDHPHDPHYVTFPTSAFHLASLLRDDDRELVLAHTVEFAVDRIRRYGVMK